MFFSFINIGQSSSDFDKSTERYCEIANNSINTNPRSGDDVGIEYIWDVDLNISEKTHYPGFPVNLNVTIRNYGDNAISTSFDIILKISDDGYPQYRYESKKTLPSSLGITDLQPKTSYNLSWNWTPPKPDGMPPGSDNDYSRNDVTFVARIETSLIGDIDPSNDKMNIEIIVSKPDFKIQLSRGWWWQNGSKLEHEGYDKTIITIKKNQINQIDLKFTLENVGEATDISYEIFTPYDWTAIPPATQFWWSGMNSSDSARNLSFLVMPSSNLKYLPYSVDLKITLKAICDTYPDIYKVLNFIVNINYIPNPVIIPPKPPDEIRLFRFQPGFEFLNFKFINMGNGKDNYQIEAIVGTLPEQTKLLLNAGWNAVVHSGKYTKVLGHGEFQNITLKLRIPSTVAADSTCPVILRATSIKDPLHEDSEINITFLISVDEFKSISFIVPIPDTISMYPNSEKKLTIYIENTGNTIDESISLNISEKPAEDWEIILDSSDIPQRGLERFGTAYIEVTIKTPKNVREQEYYINITANSENLPTDEMLITIRILEVYNFALTSANDRQFGNNTEELMYTIGIDNLGNTKDSILLEQSFVTLGMENMNWKISLSKRIVQLDHAQFKTISISVYIPSEALADTDFQTPYQDGYKIRIIGSSMNDSTVITEIELEIVVNPSYYFELDKNQRTVNLIFNNEETSVDFSFKITNLGNDIDWYDISWVSDHDWLTISFSQRRLPPGATEELYINFDSPWEKNAGTYEFLIICRSNREQTLIQELKLKVNIKIFDIAITELHLGDLPITEAKLREGDTALVRAKLENNGELNYTYSDFGKELIIGFYEGINYIEKTNLTFLPCRDSGENNSIWVKALWKISKSGSYRLRVILDPKADLPDSNKNNNEFSYDIKVKSKDQARDEEEKIISNYLTIIVPIIGLAFIFIISLLVILRRRNREKIKSQTEEYKPSAGAEVKKVEFESDYEKGFEEEPKGGVLAKPDERSELDEKREKFLSERLALVQMKPVSSMKPVKIMKPIPTSKPIIDEDNKQ
jgi:uncharacterized membrane protein